MNGIDTPEIRGKCKQEKVLALKAKQQTVMTLGGAKVIGFRNIQRGKYFRIAADVSLSAILASNLAVSYDGGTKTKDWRE